jgi:3-hydroxyacyl-CoA dehydrogenase
VHRRTDIRDDEIVERCLYPLINEGFLVLEEGIARSSADIDVVWLSGYGFPAALGGPMYHAGQIGAGAIRDRLLHFGAVSGDVHGYWRPAASLSDAVGDRHANAAHTGELS